MVGKAAVRNSMNKRAGFSLAVLATAILLLCQFSPRAFAQDQDYPPDQPQYQQGEQDPPTRAGRLSYIEGSVSFQPGGEGDWLDAVRNRPLTVGDNLWVDKDSRAEIQIGSTSIRLGPETSVTFLDLGNNVTQLRLSLGSVYFRVRRLDGDDAFEVDTPNLAFNVNRAGAYRVDTNENGDQTIAAVYRGEAEITGAGNSYRLDEGQEGTFSGTDQLSYDVGEIESPDDFGRWAQSRDEREDRARSREYVSEDMTGYEDLDDYGRWRNDPEYGNVWQPVGVPGDWAPYRYGHWAYVSPWGWTWVEDEPWGFAPFHYGRWAFVESSWCWVPGPVVVRPVYAPALVAFVGGGFGVAVGVAWFPLAPREVFVPWYRTSPGYVNNVNVTNTRVSVTQVTNVYNTTIINNNTTNVTRITYANQHVTNAVTVVNHDTFVNARPVAASMVKVDQKQIESAPVTHTIAAQPARASVMGAGRPATFKPSAAVTNRQVVAVKQPPAPPASFEQRQAAAPNVRKETPGTPQSATRAANQPARPSQPAANQPPHPQTPPPANDRAAAPTSVPHPGATPPQPARPSQPPSTVARSVPHPPATESGHPLVKPAPPVQENPQHQQNEQAKFNNWQQQRQT